MAKSIKPWPEGATVRLLPQVSDGVEPYFHQHYVRKVVYEGPVQEIEHRRRIGGGIAAAVADPSLWQDIAEQARQAAKHYREVLGCGALTVREVQRSIRRYLVGEMSFETLRTWCVPIAFDLNKAINEVIDMDERQADLDRLADEVSFERLRAQAHKIAQAALPPHLEGVTISIVKPDGSLQEIARTKGPITFGEVKPKTLGKPCCHKCSNPIVPALDAYYGKDPRGADHCLPCRREMKIT